MQGYRAKKSLGQNFLTSKTIVKKIVAAGDVSAHDTVLEIGPGKGALTGELLATGAHVIAIEKDRDLIPVLQEKFAKEVDGGRLVLREDDVLLFDPKEAGLREHSYKLVANIPYYITGEIMRRFLSETLQPSLMVVLVQKEVAERVAAKDGKESILSLSVKLYGEPKLVLRVPRKFFSPSPNVDSAVLAIKNIGRKNLSRKDEPRFFEIVKQGFSQKRKQVVPLLGKILDKETVLDVLAAHDLAPSVRAEDIPLDVWIALTK